mgnify:CR=1 FL=1
MNNMNNNMNRENFIHNDNLIEQENDLFMIREEEEPLLSDNNHTTIMSYTNYSYPSWVRDKTYVNCKNTNCLIIPFITTFFPVLNSIMLTFVLYAILQINNAALILSNPNVTDTITKIEHIIDYLCDNKIIEC